MLFRSYAIVEINAQQFTTAPKNISLKDAMDYPVLLLNQSDLDMYEENYKAIIDEFIA